MLGKHTLNCDVHRVTSHQEASGVVGESHALICSRVVKRGIEQCELAAHHNTGDGGGDGPRFILGDIGIVLKPDNGGRGKTPGLTQETVTG